MVQGEKAYQRTDWAWYFAFVSGCLWLRELYYSFHACNAWSVNVIKEAVGELKIII